ncbi:MAG: YdcF family protein [Planctomycetes bacterium]|nr:YdcF family protein [Planctomycetota bacterium]
MLSSAIIVLGNLMDHLGHLNDESIARMDLAREKTHESHVEVLMTCGWDYRDDTEITIADAMRSYGISCGISAELIVSEIHSRDTVGDAVFSKINLIKNRNTNNILVVTSDYHVRRTREIFNFVYGDQFQITVIGAFAGKHSRPSEDESLSAFRQTFLGIAAGDDVAIYNCMCSRHPFYNGSVYPKI